MSRPAFALNARFEHLSDLQGGLLNRDDLGVLAPGRLADIVAMPGDPIADISVTAKVDFVMKDGTLFRQPVH